MLLGKPPLSATVVALMLVALGCPATALLPGHSVVLPGSRAQDISQPCSRTGPPSFSETWEPSAEDIARLEANLHKLRRHRARLCCLLGTRVRDPGSYYRQYLGIIVGGRRVIYINAFSADEPPEGWRTEPVDYCDGGTGSWGAVYDPGTGRFSDLAFNGLA